MEVKAEAKYVRSSPRKVERILAVIRGKSAMESLTKLRFMPHAAAKLVFDVLNSALANAKHNYKLKENDLTISKCFVGHGTAYKRFLIKSRGRIHPIKKRTSHITVYLKEGGN